MDDDAPTIPVRMNKRTSEKTLNHMNGDHLLGLRDIRRSENGQYVRANNLAEDTTMRRKINMWYKEQRSTIGIIKRGQVGFYQNLVRVQRAKRKCQREEYKRKQEELRKGMEVLRLRRLLRRVVNKFRQNVKRKKNERAKKRFGIARGLKPTSNKDGDAAVDKHGVFGVKSQARLGSISRIVALAQKKDELQKEGVIPTNAETPKQGLLQGHSSTIANVENNNCSPQTEQSKSDPSPDLERQAANRLSHSDVGTSTKKEKRPSNPKVETSQMRKRILNPDIEASTQESEKTPNLDVDAPNSTQMERKTSNPGVHLPSSTQNVKKSPDATADKLTNSSYEDLSSIHTSNEEEKKHIQPTDDLEAAEAQHKPMARLSLENLALHEELQKELTSRDNGSRNLKQGIRGMEFDTRVGVKTTILEVNKEKPDAPKSRTLMSQTETITRKSRTVNETETESAVVETEYPQPRGQRDNRKDKFDRPALGALRVPRRASIKPPPQQSLLEMDRFSGDAVDAVGLANALGVAVSPPNEIVEGVEIGQRPDLGIRHHDKADGRALPEILPSQVIRRQRREEAHRRTVALDKELVPHYKRNKAGGLVVQMLPFNREPFNPPSNKVKYHQEKLMKEEKINMARQRVRLRRFVNQLSTEDEQRTLALKRATEEKRKMLAEKSENRGGQQVPFSISTLMFSVYHQEMPPEGVDRNSVEALKKCKYIRYYDLPNSNEHKAELKRRQKSSWESPTAYEQKQRRLLQLRRQRAAIYR